MAVSVLDVAVTFGVDKTATDTAFEQLPGQAQKAFGEADAFAQQFNSILDATAENIALAGANLPSLGQAFRTLRITGPDNLKKGVDDAALAIQALKENGITATGTLLQANIRLIEKQIAYTTAIGESAVALDAELVALKAEYEALNGIAAAKEQAAIASREMAVASGEAAIASTEQAGATEVLSGAFKGLSSALAGVFAAGFFLHFADDVAHSIDELDDMSKATGLTIGQLVGLKGAMAEAGDNSDRLGQQLSKVAEGLVKAQSGSAEQRNTFRELGVQFDATTGKAPPLLDALLQISNHLEQTKASGDNLGLAYQALGRNSIELVSFLGQGSAAIQEQIGHYKDLADETENTVAAAAEFQKLEAQLGSDLKSLALPVFREFVDLFRFTAAAVLSAKGELENFGREVLLQGQVLFELAKGLDEFNKAAIRLDFSGMEKAFKQTVQNIEIDWRVANSDIADTTAKTVKDVAKFLGELPSQVPKLKIDTEISDDGGKLAAEAAKRNLDAQLAAIDAFKAGVHAAFATGAVDAAEWAQAQVRAADLADIAQEQYLQHLIVGYQKAGDVQKAQAAIQELATLKVKDAAKETETLAAAIQKHNEFAGQMEKSWADLLSINVGKAFADATKAAQELVKAEEKLEEAQTRLEVAKVDAQFAQKIQQVEQLAAVGIISEEEKAERLKTIYGEEEAAQLASLEKLRDQQIDAINAAQAKVEEARDNPFFSDAQLDNLEKNLDQALTVYADTQTRIINTQAQADARVANTDAQILRRATSSWDGYFKEIIAGSLRSGNAVKALGVLTAEGIRASVVAAVIGAQGFGQAMEQLLKSALAALAGEAVVRALKEIAEAFSALANPPTAHLAAGHFIAAAKWGAVGAGAAIAGASVPSGRSSDQGQPSRPSDLPPTAATTPQQNQPQTVNVPRFAAGGLVSRQTLAIIGDSRSGGNSEEAVLPLRDREVMRQVAGAIVDEMAGLPQLNRLRAPAKISSATTDGEEVLQNPGPFGKDPRKFLEEYADRLSVAIGAGHLDFPEVHIHNDYSTIVKGSVVDAKGLMKVQSRAAKKGQGRLLATSAQRVVRS